MNYILIMLAFLFFLGGCSSNEDVVERAKEELPMKILIPSYIPVDLELTKAILEGNLFLLTYESEDTSTLGEYRFIPELNAYAFIFVPIISRIVYESNPSYWIRSVGVEEEEFQKVIESLQ